MNTKLNLYIDLLNAMDKTEQDYEQQETMDMVAVPSLSDSDMWYTLEVWQGKYIGGYATYDYSDNSMSYSNVGCPEFTADDLDDAIEWLVNN